MRNFLLTFGVLLLTLANASSQSDKGLCEFDFIKMSSKTITSGMRCFAEVWTNSDGSMKTESDDRMGKDGRTCMMACMIQNIGWVNSSGQLEIEKVRAFMEETIPSMSTTKKEEIYAAITECANRHEPLPFQENCTSYEDFFACTTKHMLKICPYGEYNKDKNNN